MPEQIRRNFVKNSEGVYFIEEKVLPSGPVRYFDGTRYKDRVGGVQAVSKRSIPPVDLARLKGDARDTTKIRKTTKTNPKQLDKKTA